jgi:hypothetical protein
MWAYRVADLKGAEEKRKKRKSLLFLHITL